MGEILNTIGIGGTPLSISGIPIQMKKILTSDAYEGYWTGDEDCIDSAIIFNFTIIPDTTFYVTQSGGWTYGFTGITNQTGNTFTVYPLATNNTGSIIDDTFIISAPGYTSFEIYVSQEGNGPLTTSIC